MALDIPHPDWSTTYHCTWYRSPLPPLPSDPHPVAQRLAVLANAACMSPQAMLRQANTLERFGVIASSVSDAILAEALLLYRRMPSRVEPDVKLLRQLGAGAELDTPQGDVPSPLRPVPSAPVEKRKVTRASIFGYSITAVLRWMGANGWKFEDASVVCASIGAAAIADVTIRLQLKAGKDGLRGPAAPITPSQAKRLRELAN